MLFDSKLRPFISASKAVCLHARVWRIDAGTAVADWAAVGTQQNWQPSGLDVVIASQARVLRQSRSLRG